MPAEKLITESAMDGVNVIDLENNSAGAIIDHMDIWTSSVKAKSAVGRGSNKKIDLYGIKKLRELILELAVRGKLVPQDPSDEPASELLERIAEEKEKLIKEKKIKKPKKLPDISKDEFEFDLPSGWEWTRLNDIGEWGSGSTPKRDMSEYYNGNIPWFKSGELNSDYIFESEEKITALALKNTSVRYNNIGDVLVAMYGATIGKTSILKVRATTNQAVCACTPFSGFLNTYLLLLLKAYKTRLIGMGAGGAQPNISREKIINTVLALPSEIEQHRIVAKVDELMALCDKLEQQTQDSIDAHQLLVETLLATLTNNQKGADFTQNWARLHTHFDILFTTERSIDALKQTILQLAVMGKLVPQNPNDEPASKLLERIAKEKAQLIKDKKIKKQKDLPPITEEEKPFDLPKGWEWCRLGDLELTSEAGWSPKCLDTPRENGTWGVLKVSSVTWGTYNPLENKELPASLEPRKHLEVQNGDFLISRANTAVLVAKAVVVPINSPKKLMMSDKIIRFRFSQMVDAEFINLFNDSIFVRDYYAKVAGGTSSSMKNVSRDQIRNLLVALSPFEEQKIIINMVESFFTICEELKQRLRDSQQTQLLLTDAIVEQAL